MRHTKMQWNLGFITFTGEVTGDYHALARIISAMERITRTKLGSAWSAEGVFYE